MLLATLGGIQFLKEDKSHKREAAGLSQIEDTLEIASSLKPVIYGNEDSDFISSFYF